MCSKRTEMTKEDALFFLGRFRTKGINEKLYDAIGVAIEALSAQPERTEYIPEIKAVRSKRDCVDLSERVSATFYDQEHEEWTQQTVTIADVLDSVCDEYTILPSVQPEPLTDKEQRIFLAAMEREEKVCQEVDDEWRDCREPYEDSLMRVCKEIRRKVKGALWA